MTDLTDQDVVHQLGGAEARNALAELVRRYGGLVYSVALRQVRDRHLAEDITQAVFIVLVRKAHSIRPNAVLAAWFFTVTRHASQNAMRIERRRRHHETKKAATMRDEYLPADAVESGSNPLLVEAITRLQESDRSAVVLRYFQNRSHREIAQALSVSEETARKRLTRAVQKMRTFLERRGVGDAETALSSGLAQSISMEPVPSAMVSSIVNVALISHAAMPSASVLSIARGAARMITFTPQVKAAMITVGVLGVLGAAAVPMLRSAPASAPTSQPTSQQAPDVVAAAPAAAPVADDLNDVVVAVSDNIKVHLLGISSYPGDADSWWSASGTPIGKPNAGIPLARFKVTPVPTNQVLMRIEKSVSVMARCSVVGSMSGFSTFSNSGTGKAPGDEIDYIAFTPQPDEKTMTMRILFAEGDWQTIVTDDKPGEDGDFDAKGYGKFSIQAVAELAAPIFPPRPAHIPPVKPLPTVIVTHRPVADPMQIVVIDDQGNAHNTVGNSQSMANGQAQNSDRFDLPLANVKQVLVQVRPFNKKLEISDISMMPGQTTNPQATVGDVSPGNQANQGGHPSIGTSRTNSVITIPPNGK